MSTNNYADYGKLAEVQKTAVQLVFDKVKEVFGNVLSKTQDKVTVCEYGGADGLNSLPFIKYFQEILNDRELVWICNDLPGNNFQPLFLDCYNQILENTKDDNQLYILASGKSFYSQVAPTNSVNFGVCLSAVHWLSKCPVSKPGIDYQTHHQLVKDIGADDWKNFLLHRGHEINEGGRLVVSVASEPCQNIGSNQHTEFLGLYGLQSAITHMHQSLQITKEEYARMWFPSVVFRSEEDICAPFQDPIIQEIGVKLVSLRKYSVPDIQMREWQAKGGHKNAAATKNFVDKQVSSLKSVTSMILPKLDERRSLEEKHKILDILFKLVQEEITSDPYKYSSSWSFFLVEIEKHGSQTF